MLRQPVVPNICILLLEMIQRMKSFINNGSEVLPIQSPQVPNPIDAKNRPMLNVPLQIEVKGKLTVISKFPVKDAAMKLLTSMDDLPKGVKDFVDRLQIQPNVLAIFEKNGVLYAEINLLSILKSYNTFVEYLTFYHDVLKDFPQLSPYVELMEATESNNIISRQYIDPNGKKQIIGKIPIPVSITRHFYVIVRVEALIIDTLKQTLVPEKERSLDVAASVAYLAKHGFDDDKLQAQFGVTQRSLQRYRKKLENNDNLS